MPFSIHSDQINELAAALSKAQGMMGNAVMNRINPHFKSKYADMGSVLDAVRPPLSANGLSIVQPMQITENGLVLRTILMHSSGQYIAAEYPLPAAQNQQAMGSALTYARRYSLSALVCNASDEDDDANGSVDADESRKRFIEQCTAKIAELDDPRSWWNSESQKRARRDFELGAAEVLKLKNMIIAKIGSISHEPGSKSD